MPRTPPWLEALAICAFVLMAGCSSGGADRSAPPEQSSSVTSSAPVPAQPRQAEPGLGANNGDWTVVAGPDERLQAATIGANWIALTVRDGSVTQIVATSLSGEPTRFHTLESGSLVQFVAMTQDRVLAVDSNDTTGVARIVELVEEGQPGVVLWQENWFIPDLVALGDRFFHTRISDTDQFCITELGAAQDLFCNPRGSIIRLAANGTNLSFVEFPLNQPDEVRTCGTLYLLDPFEPQGESKPEKVPTSGCMRSGMAAANLAAWSEEPVPDDTGYVDYFDVRIAAHDGFEESELGRGGAGSVTLCGSKVFWAATTDGGADEIRSWEPGGEVTTVFVAPVDEDGSSRSVSRPFCSDDEVAYVQRYVGLTGSAQEVLVQGWADATWIAISSPAAREVVSVADAFGEFEALDAWVAGRSENEIAGFVQSFCAEVAAEPDVTRVEFLWSEEASNRWIADFGLEDMNQLFVFRIAAVRTGCSEYQDLVTGN